MANILAPFGFQFLGLLNGTPPNFAPQSMLIQANYNVAIGQNDAVTLDTNGYITRVASGTAIMAGVFVGCKYLSVAFQRTVWRNYWPGTADSVGDIEAYVISHPDSLFKVQMSGAAPARADIGGNYAFSNATPNAANGLSTMTLTSAAVSALITQPFKLYDFYSHYGIPGENGTDDASANNMVVVLAVNWSNKTQTGQ